MRGATRRDSNGFRVIVISIHTPHAGSDLYIHYSKPLDLLISIHTPHAGSDWYNYKKQEVQKYFNPHSPCGERLTRTGGRKPRELFQSTLPMRGAT